MLLYSLLFSRARDSIKLLGKTRRQIGEKYPIAKNTEQYVWRIMHLKSTGRVEYEFRVSISLTSLHLFLFLSPVLIKTIFFFKNSIDAFKFKVVNNYGDKERK